MKKIRIGKAIAYFRKVKGITQIEFAELTGLPQPQLSLYESQRRNPTKEKMQKITQVLQVTEEELIKKAEEINKKDYSNKITAPQHVSSIPKRNGIDFYITEDMFVSLKSILRVVKDDEAFTDDYKNTVINEIVEKSVYLFLIENHKSLESYITEKLHEHRNTVENLIEKVERK